jgi:hypothetical protein
MGTLDALGTLALKLIIPMLVIFAFMGCVVFVLAQIPIDGMSSTGLISQTSVLSFAWGQVKDFIASIVHWW